jgi:fructokinase
MPGLPVAIDTDVNAAAIGEQRWGNGSGQENLVYVTMGTGIGAGLIAGGRIVHGLVHPEMGHMAIPRLPGDSFPGTCPWHGACWEGLCSGPALRERTGIPADQLPAIHEIWELAASYTAAALSNIVLVTSPHKIILGGSVAKAGELGSEGFLNLIRSRLQSLLNGYLSAPALILRIDSYVVGPGLGDNSGVCGALAMAQDAIHNTVDRAD